MFESWWCVRSYRKPFAQCRLKDQVYPLPLKVHKTVLFAQWQTGTIFSLLPFSHLTRSVRRAHRSTACPWRDATSQLLWRCDHRTSLKLVSFSPNTNTATAVTLIVLTEKRGSLNYETQVQSENVQIQKRIWVRWNLKCRTKQKNVQSPGISGFPEEEAPPQCLWPSGSLLSLVSAKHQKFTGLFHS